MSKEKNRGNKEVRKPKADKPAVKQATIVSVSQIPTSQTKPKAM